MRWRLGTELNDPFAPFLAHSVRCDANTPCFLPETHVSYPRVVFFFERKRICI
jgi:hypothetical protein